MFFNRGENELIQRVERRLAAWTNLPAGNGEGIQVLRYEVRRVRAVEPGQARPGQARCQARCLAPVHIAAAGQRCGCHSTAPPPSSDHPCLYPPVRGYTCPLVSMIPVYSHLSEAVLSV